MSEISDIHALRSELRSRVAEQLAAIGFRDSAEFERLLRSGGLAGLVGEPIGWVAMRYAQLPALGEERSALFLLCADRCFTLVDIARGLGLHGDAELIRAEAELEEANLDELRTLLSQPAGSYESVPNDVYDGGPTTLTIGLVGGGRAEVSCNVSSAGDCPTLGLARFLWRLIHASPRGAVR